MRRGISSAFSAARRSLCRLPRTHSRRLDCLWSACFPHLSTPKAHSSLIFERDFASTVISRDETLASNIDPLKDGVSCYLASSQTWSAAMWTSSSRRARRRLQVARQATSRIPIVNIGQSNVRSARILQTSTCFAPIRFPLFQGVRFGGGRIEFSSSMVILLELSEDGMVRRMPDPLNYGSFREWCRHRLGLGTDKGRCL